MSSTRSEQIYISRSAKSGLEALAMMAGASAPEDTPLASVDAMADEIIRRHLDAQPLLAERKRAIRKALNAVDAEFAGRLEAGA